MTIKKSQIKEEIKAIVREALSERAYRQLLKEVSPPGAKAERQIQHVKASLRDTHPDWSEDKVTSVAIATAWKSQKNEQVGADVVADEQYETDEAGLTSEEKKKNWIAGAVKKSHKGYCTPMTKKTCTPRRKALAKRFKKGLEEIIDKLVERKLNEAMVNMKMGPSYKVVPKTLAKTSEPDQPARTVQYEPDVNEAAYKQVSPNETDTAKENKPLTIQTEPKVTENHKVQHRSYKTVDDMDNKPENVRDPEVPMS